MLLSGKVHEEHSDYFWRYCTSIDLYLVTSSRQGVEVRICRQLSQNWQFRKYRLSTKNNSNEKIVWPFSHSRIIRSSDSEPLKKYILSLSFWLSLDSVQGPFLRPRKQPRCINRYDVENGLSLFDQLTGCVPPKHPRLPWPVFGCCPVRWTLAQLGQLLLHHSSIYSMVDTLLYLP